MTGIEALVKAWDTCHWELGEAFKGLGDDDVWRRADPALLSIGEIAGHIAYGEATNCCLTADSPLVDEANRYYPVTVRDPFVAQLGAEETYGEIQRIHALAKESFLEKSFDPDALNPRRPDWTWLATLEYMVFHTAYHTGQIYSVRHLMGHETEDN